VSGMDLRAGGGARLRLKFRLGVAGATTEPPQDLPLE